MTDSNATVPPAAEPFFSATFDRSFINHSGGSYRYLVVTVRAPEAESQVAEKLPINLALVLDASGSMNGPRLDAARLAAKQLIEKLGDDERVSLVSFATDVIVHGSGMALDPMGRATLVAALDTMHTRGSTDLGAGWLQGCECAALRKATADRMEQDHVFLLSDGHANHGIIDPVVLARHANELRQRGISTSTIGVGMDYSPMQLQAIAEAGGGRMHDAEQPHEIAEIMLAELGDARATALRDVELTIDLPQGVRAHALSTAQSLSTHGRLRVVLGSMLSKAERTIVIQVETPPQFGAPTIALHASLSWRTPTSDDRKSIDHPPCELTFSSAVDCMRQPRNLKATQTTAMHWQTWVVHQAMQRNQDGRIGEGQHFAEQQLRYLERYCQGVPECQVYVEALQRYAPTMRDRYDTRVAKEVMLKSYKFSRSEQDRRSYYREDGDEFLPPRP
jgi:Ca-activated chloride channel family protein